MARRTREQIEDVKLAAIAVLHQDNPMTLRQTFYQLVVLGVIGKTEADYKSLGRMLVKMRETGDIDWDWIIDLGREIQLPQMYLDTKDALQQAAEYYRVDRQRHQPYKIVVAIESHGLGSVIWPMTAKYSVALIASGGYASASIKYKVTEQLVEDGRPVKMFYFGDYDPSGQDISRDWNDTIIRYAEESLSTYLDMDFVHSALTPEQIEEWNLPGKPPKPGDSRTANFEGECVELDALPKRQLLGLVEDAILTELDETEYEADLKQEQIDRDEMHEFIKELDV